MIPTDVQRLEGKLDALAAQVAQLVGAQQRTQTFFESMTPIATQALGVGAQRLADLEQRGYFDFAREAAHVVDTLIAGYTPDDVHALSEQVVRMVGLVRRLTQPAILDAAESAADAAGTAGNAEPPGVLGMLKATASDQDVRRGLMVALAVLREVGRAAHPSEPSHALATINPLLGAQRNLRPGAPGPSPAPPRATPPVHDDTPSAAWTPALAQTLAASHGIATLTDRHWKVIEFARAEYASTSASPNIRRLTAGSGVPTKELYALFPRAPAKTAAIIAGLPKPVGCI